MNPTGPRLVIDGDALLRLLAEALVDSPATCRLLIGMGFLEDATKEKKG